MIINTKIMGNFLVEDLVYAIGKKTIINGVSHRFSKGKISALLGANGSGKTTLLKLLCGIFTPLSGTIRWQNNPFAELSRREKSQTVAFVPQQSPLPFPFSVQEIVEMGAYAIESPKPLEEVLSLLHILPLRHRKISSLSMGERELVYIARALIADTPVLLLDEPTAHLDIVQRHRVWESLVQCANEGKTVLVALHEITQARRYCQEFLLLKEGRFLATGSSWQAIQPEQWTSLYSTSDLQPFLQENVW